MDTKDKLTIHLAAREIEHRRETGKSYVVASRDTVNASDMDVNRLQSIQEEADNKFDAIGDATTITKTRLYNFDPLKPHFYIVKLGFTGVCIIFPISAQKT